MIRIAHVITRLIRGGAQENTLHSVIGHAASGRFTAELISGPTWGSEGSLVPEVKRHRIRHRLVPSLLRELNPILDGVALVHLAAIFRRRRYRLVHTHSSKAGILGRLAARLARVPVVVHTAHGWGFNDHQPRWIHDTYVRLERRCARCCDALVTVTSRDADKGLELGIGTPELYTTIRSGIDLERFGRPARLPGEMRAELGIPPGCRVVGSVMRLSPQKAPLDWIDAAAEVSRTAPEARFVVVGDGPLRSRVEARITELGLADRVVLTGIRADVPELLAAFDVFALSSLWEGLPRVLPQAMAAGLPVVATAVAGSAEVVEPSVNGLLTPPGDPEALAAAVLKLLRDPGAAGEMGAAGRRRAAEFDVRRMVADLESLYDDLLARRGAIDIPWERT